MTVGQDPCSASAAFSFTELPVQRIEEIVKPTGPQQTALDQLKQASDTWECLTMAAEHFLYANDLAANG